MAQRQRKEPTPEEYRDPLRDYSHKSPGSEFERLLQQEKATAIQATPVIMVAPDATVAGVLAKMDDLGIACVLVADQGRLVGIFTERDVLTKVADRYAQVKDQPVSQVMTANPVAVYETDNVAAALSVIAASNLRHAPVLDVDERIIGVISPQRITGFLLEHADRAAGASV